MEEGQTFKDLEPAVAAISIDLIKDLICSHLDGKSLLKLRQLSQDWNHYILSNYEFRLNLNEYFEANYVKHEVALLSDHRLMKTVDGTLPYSYGVGITYNISKNLEKFCKTYGPHIQNFSQITNRGIMQSVYTTLTKYCPNLEKLNLHLTTREVRDERFPDYEDTVWYRGTPGLKKLKTIEIFCSSGEYYYPYKYTEFVQHVIQAAEDLENLHISGILYPDLHRVKLLSLSHDGFYHQSHHADESQHLVDMVEQVASTLEDLTIVMLGSKVRDDLCLPTLPKLKSFTTTYHKFFYNQPINFPLTFPKLESLSVTLHPRLDESVESCESFFNFSARIKEYPNLRTFRTNCSHNIERNVGIIQKTFPNLGQLAIDIEHSEGAVAKMAQLIAANNTKRLTLRTQDYYEFSELELMATSNNGGWNEDGGKNTFTLEIDGCCLKLCTEENAKLFCKFLTGFKRIEKIILRNSHFETKDALEKVKTVVKQENLPIFFKN